MRILLDNCVPRKLRAHLTGHEVRTAHQAGFARLENGDLLREAGRNGYDVLLTTDKNIRHQHDLASLPVAVVQLDSRFTRLADLLPLVPHLPAALEATGAYRFVSVDATGVRERLAPKPSP